MINKSAYLDYIQRNKKVLAALILVITGGLVTAGAVIVSKAVSPSKKSIPQAQQTGQQLSISYSSYDNNVSIQAPEVWSLKENPQPGTQAVFLSAKEGQDDKFIENVGLQVSDLSAKPNVILDEVLEAWTNQSQSEFPDSFKVLSQDKTTLGGVEAVKITYQAKGEALAFKGMSVFTLNDSKAYVINYSAEEKSFNKFLAEVNQIIDSFKFGGVVLDWETYKNSEMGYSVKHPKGWVAKDSSGEANRKLTVSHPKNFANVLIASHKDDSLKEEGGMTKAIKGRKEFLESDKELKISGFKDTVEDKKGGWLMVGEKTIDGQKWQLEERGLVDVYGKVVLMQSGYSENYGKQYKDVVRQIMDNFSVE